jgi:hypothetical protein
MEALRKFWHAWKAFGRFMGNMVARVVLSLFYFTIFVPFAIGARLFTDPLHLKGSRAALWMSRQTGDQTLDESGRQF